MQEPSTPNRGKNALRIDIGQTSAPTSHSFEPAGPSTPSPHTPINGPFSHPFAATGGIPGAPKLEQRRWRHSSTDPQSPGSDDSSDNISPLEQRRRRTQRNGTPDYTSISRNLWPREGEPGSSRNAGLGLMDDHFASAVESNHSALQLTLTPPPEPQHLPTTEAPCQDGEESMRARLRSTTTRQRHGAHPYAALMHRKASAQAASTNANGEDKKRSLSISSNNSSASQQHPACGCRRASLRPRSSHSRGRGRSRSRSRSSSLSLSSRTCSPQPMILNLSSLQMQQQQYYQKQSSQSQAEPAASEGSIAATVLARRRATAARRARQGPSEVNDPSAHTSSVSTRARSSTASSMMPPSPLRTVAASALFDEAASEHEVGESGGITDVTMVRPEERQDDYFAGWPSTYGGTSAGSMQTDEGSDGHQPATLSMRDSSTTTTRSDGNSPIKRTPGGLGLLPALGFLSRPCRGGGASPHPDTDKSIRRASAASF